MNIHLLNAQDSKNGVVIDIDSNIYSTVKVGKYLWMTENLRTTTYKNGLKIPNVKDNNTWISTDSGAYCWYNNDTSNAKVYGALYNWYAVNTGNLCPDGWRVPSDEEWKYLEGYVDTKFCIGDSSWNSIGLRGNDAGLRLKTKSGWSIDGNGTDHFNFSALPSGERLSRNGKYFIMGSNGFWWSSTEYNTHRAWYRSIIYTYNGVMRYFHDKQFGFSVRCLRDN